MSLSYSEPPLGALEARARNGSNLTEALFVLCNSFSFGHGIIMLIMDQSGQESNKAIYQRAIVTFIDILGFRQLVMQSSAARVNQVLEAVQQSNISPKSASLDPEDTLYEPQVIIFSDTVVRVRKIETSANLEYPIGLVFQELLDLVHIQGGLIAEDILLRGGVTFGDVLCEGNRIFGPALIDAYEIESEYALFPRIVVSPLLLMEYKKNSLLRAAHHTRLEDELPEIKSLLREGDDGMWFVDYARAIKTEFDEPEMYRPFLKKHRDVILFGCKQFRTLNSILAKYIWLAKYHNSIINTLDAARFKYRDRLLIATRNIRMLQDL